MNALSSFINGLQSLFSFSSKPPQGMCAIHRTSLLNIFQLFNTELFDISENISLNDEGIQEAALEYAQIGSSVADHLTNQEFTHIKFKSQFIREDGAALLFLEYDHTAVENNTESWATLILSTFSFHAGEIETVPHFTLSGIYSLCPTTGGLLFIPRDATCLVHKDGEKQCYQPSDQDEFNSALVYGSQAFTQLMAGLPIDVAENQKWMSVENHTEAAKICENLILRTSSTFVNDMKLATSKLTFQ